MNPGPLHVIWFVIGLMLLVAVLSFLVPALARRNRPTPENCWKAGIFYVNHEDPALFVPKRFGIGYTLNFGNPWSWAVLALIGLLAIAPIIFAVFSVRTHLSRAP